ncbi:MAG: hypothetical protein H7Y22_10160 [Gemmatimonadaceae bacterium]|nr:hypothetical protein [Gloeobacterales cyanobacterium ES-bin-141]
MNDPRPLKQQAQILTEQVGDTLARYLVLHNRLFTWKNIFGWNQFEEIKLAIPPLVEQLNQITADNKQGLELAAQLPDELLDKPVITEFYRFMTEYLDALRLSVQIMGRLLTQLEAKSLKTGAFKQSAYEADLVMYKKKIDTYQLYGMELNRVVSTLKH